MKFLRAFGHGLRVGVGDFRHFWTWKSWLAGWMTRMITNAVMWVMLGQLLGSQAKLDYLLIGVAVTSGVGSIVIAVTTWDRSMGAYPLLVASPLGPAPAIMGRAAIWMFSWLPASLLTFLFLAAAFDFRPPPAAILLLPCMVSVICFSAYGMGVFLGAIVAGAPALRNILNQSYVTLLMAFCGVSVPVNAWPGWIEATAQVLPITHGLAAIRLMLAEGPAQDVLRGTALEALVGTAWLVLALLTFRRLAERGRADGSIDFLGNG